MYIYETWAFWKKPKKMKVLGFCKVFFFLHTAIYIVVDCFLKLQRVKFRVEIKNLTPGTSQLSSTSSSSNSPRTSKLFLVSPTFDEAKASGRNIAHQFFSELKVRQSFSLRKRDRFEYLLCPSCFVVLCQSFPTMAESCVRYVRSFPSFFFSNCLLARRSFIAVELHFAGDEKVCVYPPSG